MDNALPVVRAPSLKRGKAEERISDRIKLERVLGVTITTNSALDSCSSNQTIAYPAGCTVVLLNNKTKQQSHIINTNRKSITSLAFSSCGRYLVTGESGHQPAVRVWDLQSDPQAPGYPGLAPQIQEVAVFKSHKHGINCVAFSPTGKYIVSIGSLHDMIVNVWDWKHNIKIASNKVSNKVKALSFAENGSYFVTVGNRNVKYWYLEHGSTKFKEAVPLMGRSAILGDLRNNNFCDVACGRGECANITYAITRSGLLCEFNQRRLLDRWVELRTPSANCMTIANNHIFVGCAEGIVRCFDPLTLNFITTLPRPHYLGVDVALGLSMSHMSPPVQGARYPDTTAITYDEINKKLTCVYNDHSIYVWDVLNIKHVGKSNSYLYHAACIWGVEMAPDHSPLPPGSFLTCSSDDTVRVWSLDKNFNNSKYNRNIYSDELAKVVYIDKDYTYLKDQDLSGVNEKQGNVSYDSRNGVRSIRISPDGKHLASGDRSGNIHIHDTSNMIEFLVLEAHDAEVLSLEYTSFNDKKMMASASRDRLIHVFDITNGYSILQTLDDHSSSITAVRFLNTSGDNLQMVSCGADKSVIFRYLAGTPNGTMQFQRTHNASGKTTLYDMEVDVGQKHVLTACQDRYVRIFGSGTGKQTKSFKGAVGDDGSLIKVALDRSGIYLATSCTDKSLSVYDYYTGECMATMCGHSELATGLKFTNDCRRLISASGDGCIFVWRVPHDMVVTMHARLSQQAMRQGKPLDSQILLDNSNMDFYESTSNFDNCQLPLWAKKHISDDSSPPISLSRSVVQPRGRWAQRADQSIAPKSFYNDNSDPCSSLDSGTETRQYTSETRTEVHISKSEDGFMVSDCYNEMVNDRGQIISGATEHRRTLLTDDSALGSMRDQDLESNAHDGDIDSDQEFRHQSLYPLQTDSASGSEFPVTNIDVDELRKSIRKSKRNIPHITLPTSTGSPDSDDDDDEASTPSGDNTDRNPMSMLSVSSESLDQLGNREKYLQSAFESLSGTELDVAQNKSSFSSQYHRSGANNRNADIINATRLMKNDAVAIKKREELRKRIEDTKRKLQNVGSPLRYSQSTVDLSHIPEKDKWKSPARQQGNLDLKENYNITNCSLHDLQPTNQVLLTSETSEIVLPSSISLPSDLQLCGCYMKDIERNTQDLSNIFQTLKPQYAPKPQKSPEKKGLDLTHYIKPRKEQLDKTLAKYKMHKSLPVSPVSEECRLADFAEENAKAEKPIKNEVRHSFSYFVDLNSGDDKVIREGFDQIFKDIEKLKNDAKYDPGEKKKKKSSKLDYEEEDGNFSSDSLEDCSFSSTRNLKPKITAPPRRCVSNNEIYKYQFEEIDYSKYLQSYECRKSESFYLNQSNKNSQESILSCEYEDDGFMRKSRSFCNSMESVLSNESDCKSAPLEVLFMPYRQKYDSRLYGESSQSYTKSLPKNTGAYVDSELSEDVLTNDMAMRRSQSLYAPVKSEVKVMKTSQTQTDLNFETPEEKVAKKLNTSADFQRKLLKFESCIAQNDVKTAVGKKSIAFFVQADTEMKKTDNYIREKNNENTVKKTEKKKAVLQVSKSKNNSTMEIPTLASKNKQYKSKFCNVLNNKPELNVEIFESGAPKHSTNNFTLTNLNFDKPPKNNARLIESSSLDRHLLTKSLLGGEKIMHKPPKAVRRHSSKIKKGKVTYEYIKKDDYYDNESRNKPKNTDKFNNENYAPEETSIELSYKEKNYDRECTAGNHSIFNELYDSLDKSPTKIEYDSLEVNINLEEPSSRFYDSLEIDHRNLWKKNEIDKVPNEKLKHDIPIRSFKYNKPEVKPLNTHKEVNENILDKSILPFDLRESYLQEFDNINDGIDKIQVAMQNIKILNEIQRKIEKVNCLIEVYRQNAKVGKVKALSNMYETFIKNENAMPKFRRRNLSLPNCVERRLNCDRKEEVQIKHCSRKDGAFVPKNPEKKIVSAYLSVNSPENSLRRSCSLSELNVQPPASQKSLKNNTGATKTAKNATMKPPNNRYSMRSSSMTRSRSMGVLVQPSDSETEPEKRHQSRLMRPTISSQNKVNSTGKANLVRKRHSHSVMNLRSVGQDDSSSEELEKPLIAAKPIVPPRTRMGNGINEVVRRQQMKEQKAHRNLTPPRYSSDDLERTFTENQSSDELDVTTVELSAQLCYKVSEQLMKTASNVVQLHQRLTYLDNETSSSDFRDAEKNKSLMAVKTAITTTMKTLQNLSADFSSMGGENYQRDVLVKNLNDLIKEVSQSDQSSVVTMMNKFSDILLAMMEQKMNSSP